MAVFKIRGAVKNYEWGKLGIESMVANLQNSAHNFTVDEKVPYAELWLGTHESGPATIPHLSDRKVQDWLKDNKDTLGHNINKHSDPSIGLPFLFKVLSVNKALSIQAHPDKDTATKLHRKFPQHYPDENHKPELAIALTNFKALCGFRPLTEIKEFLIEIKELREVVGLELTDGFLNSRNECDLRSVFTAVMTASSSVFQTQLLQIAENFKLDKYTSNISSSVKDIFLKTLEQYPGDIGCFCFFFLNYVNLKSGEAIFLAANEPHAYLYGDCVECMACSDNVIRAGLTPKFRDVQTLCNTLTYICKPGDENKFPVISDPNDPFVKLYNPPVKEFSIQSISLPPKSGIYNLTSLESASVLLVIEGDGVVQCSDNEIDFCRGTSFFISSNSQIKIDASSAVLMFRAYCSD